MGLLAVVIDLVSRCLLLDRQGIFHTNMEGGAPADSNGRSDGLVIVAEQLELGGQPQFSGVGVLKRPRLKDEFVEVLVSQFRGLPELDLRLARQIEALLDTARRRTLRLPRRRCC